MISISLFLRYRRSPKDRKDDREIFCLHGKTFSKNLFSPACECHFGWCQTSLAFCELYSNRFVIDFLFVEWSFFVHSFKVYDCLCLNIGNQITHANELQSFRQWDIQMKRKWLMTNVSSQSLIKSPLLKFCLCFHISPTVLLQNASKRKFNEVLSALAVKRSGFQQTTKLPSSGIRFTIMFSSNDFTNEPPAREIFLDSWWMTEFVGVELFWGTFSESNLWGLSGFSSSWYFKSSTE